MARTTTLLSCVSALALFQASVAFAADAPAAQAPAQGATPAAAASGDALETVVVTAQKREQNLQKVPMSVTALTATTLQQAGVTDMHAVSNLVPSLSVSQTIGPVNQSYRIRGMGSDANIPTFEPDVALFVDGVYMPRSGLSVDDLADVARIEVLEGPQSTLYGKNATAGVVNVVTQGPTRHWTGSIEGSISDLDSSISAPVYRAAGTISGPINDSLRFRLSAVTYNQGDSYKNLFPGAPNANDMNRYSVRGVVDADLPGGSTLRLALSRSQMYNTRNGDPDNLYYTTSPPNHAYALDTNPILASKFGIQACPDNDPNDRVICTSSPWNDSAFNNTGSATLDVPIGRLKLTSITAASNYRVDDKNGDIAQVLLPLLSYNDIQKGNDFSQELRLASPAGDKVEWLIGGFYDHSIFSRGDDGQQPTFIVGPAGPYVPLGSTLPLSAIKVGQPGDEGFLNSRERSDYGALFGNLTWHVTDKITLSGGVRGQIDSKHASVDNSYSVTPTKTAVPCGYPLGLITISLTPTQTPSCPGTAINSNFSHSDSYVTWNTTGEYHFTNETMAYASVSRGEKGFGYNIGFGNALPSQRQFQNESVYDYEVGLKSTFLDGRARIAASLFYTLEDNYQAAGFVGLQFLVNNAAKVTVKGAEVNGSFALGHGFTLDGAANYVDAVYTDYVGGQCYFGEAANNGAGGCNLSGMGLPMTPHWRTNVGLQYRTPVSLGSLYARADWAWQSSMYADTNLDPRSLQSAYSLVNLRVGVDMSNGVGLALWANNVANTTYSQADYVSNLFGQGDPAYQRFLGRPREFGATVKKTF
jgi:iron complex outermembrane receptor protein